MKTALGLFTCAYGHQFEAPLLGDMSYGEFLLWSENRELAYLNSFAEATFEEVSELIAEIEPYRSPEDRAEITQRLYGPIACDPAASGATFAINVGPRCPHCGGVPESWMIIDLPRLSDEIAPVTHARWAALPRAEKVKRLKSAL